MEHGGGIFVHGASPVVTLSTVRAAVVAYWVEQRGARECAPDGAEPHGRPVFYANRLGARERSGGLQPYADRIVYTIGEGPGGWIGVFDDVEYEHADVRLAHWLGARLKTHVLYERYLENDDADADEPCVPRGRQWFGPSSAERPEPVFFGPDSVDPQDARLFAVDGVARSEYMPLPLFGEALVLWCEHCGPTFWRPHRDARFGPALNESRDPDAIRAAGVVQCSGREVTRRGRVHVLEEAACPCGAEIAWVVVEWRRKYPRRVRRVTLEPDALAQVQLIAARSERSLQVALDLSSGE